MRVGKVFRFEAAHALEDWPLGHKCRRLHGHSYKVEVEVVGDVNPETGAVVDFAEISKRFREYVFDLLDHRNINDVLGVRNATAEYLATWIAGRMSVFRVRRVRVWETEDSYAEYAPGE
jgi:6-pyruvoyltetrahydropterin/6-carboxytetrahydropterin synthase